MVAERWAASRYAADRLQRVDALIVLGGGVNPDQTQNFIGRMRARAAAGVLRDGRADVAILTGTLNDPAFPRGEAGLFADHMLTLGISGDAMILEPNARTTLENLRFSFALGDAAGFERYAVVTDAFHLPRALALAAFLGRDVQGLAARGFLEHGHFMRIGLILREAMAWWYNAGKVAAWHALGLIGYDDATREEMVY
ncbi:MAG: YdcF family protein [Pseudomonadota bacterium]